LEVLLCLFRTLFTREVEIMTFIGVKFFWRLGLAEPRNYLLLGINTTTFRRQLLHGIHRTIHVD
jgi:hypothetical protein